MPRCETKRIYVKNNEILVPINDHPKLMKLNFDDLSLEWVIEISTKAQNF